MPSLKTIDRMALAAMLFAATSIPLAARALALPADSPAAKIAMPDGTERRFYTSGPMGSTTFRVDVSNTGAVLARKQVLSDDVFNTIRPGMHASEVFALIGPPFAKVRFNSTHTTAWDYHYRDTWGYGAEFSVIVNDDDIVVGRFTTREGD
jgi:outer membrane protein assembly factor BamE (lipoprotein component of BamABCDE complex)